MVSFNRILRSVAVATAFVAATNCSESATSPTSAPFHARPSFNVGGGNSLAHFADKNANTFGIGVGHSVTISQANICDLATSSYGPGTWDNPCTLSADSVAFTSTVSTTLSGHPRIDFQPAMRFAPGTGDVIIVFADSAAAANPNSVILYCDASNTCVDESKTDSSLRTYHDTVRGIVYRKIKHFSGYAVSGDGSCDPTQDPTCIITSTVSLL
jgi:hypothetical protein